jgi:hypothetical protein
MKIKRTEQHSAFFALMNKKHVKPRVVTDMGFVNGCWQEIAITTKGTPVVSNVTARHQAFGVSLADAFANMEVLP